ncbi:Spy/CpxP family protein refolding chaperone [Nitratifractor sp.]
MIRKLFMTGWVLCFLQTAAIADDERHDSPKKHSSYMPRDLHGLELSRQQLQTIEKALRENMRLLRQFRSEESRLKRVMRKLFLSDSFDVKEYSDRAQKLYKKKIDTEIRLLKTIHRVLTPEQRKKFASQLDEWEID